MISSIDLQLQTLDINSIKDQAGFENETKSPHSIKQAFLVQKQNPSPNFETSPQSKKEADVNPQFTIPQDYSNKIYDNANVDSPKKLRSYESLLSYHQEVLSYSY